MDSVLTESEVVAIYNSVAIQEPASTTVLLGLLGLTFALIRCRR
jgi:hypothetical protein